MLIRKERKGRCADKREVSAKLGPIEARRVGISPSMMAALLKLAW
jgi:hypothetical protein